MTTYKPGLHILSTFTCGQHQLMDAAFCKQVFDDIITGLQLQKVGEVYHGFPGAGYTAVVCLTESHVSIHTWPEHQLATFDVFLSSFERDNADRVQHFFVQVVERFGATVTNKQEITR